MQKWFYIQWHNDTHNRPQMQDVIMEFGWEAYGIYVALTEILHKNGGELPLHSLRSVAWTLHISLDRLMVFVEKYANVGLIYFTDDVIFSTELQTQFNKQKNAVMAARIRWDNKQLPSDTREETQPQPQQQPQIDLSDSQKQSMDILINKLKYTSEKAEQIAREYGYDYIIEKMNYLMEMIKKNDIRSPHAYFEKALKENWISSSSIVVEEKETPKNNISIADINVQKFLDEFKRITRRGFPQSLKGELRGVIDNKESDIMLALDVVGQNYDNDNFYKAINIERKDILSGSVFLNGQITGKVVEYWRNHNVFAGRSLSDVMDIMGVDYGIES